jgi:hypothetical protein
MCGTCEKAWHNEKCIQKFGQETSRQKGYMGDLSIDGRII